VTEQELLKSYKARMFNGVPHPVITLLTFYQRDVELGRGHPELITVGYLVWQELCWLNGDQEADIYWFYGIPVRWDPNLPMHEISYGGPEPKVVDEAGRPMLT